MTWDRTAEPVSRDQFSGANGDSEKIIFPCSADHEQDSQLYPVDPNFAKSADYAYIHK